MLLANKLLPTYKVNTRTEQADRNNRRMSGKQNQVCTWSPKHAGLRENVGTHSVLYSSWEVTFSHEWAPSPSIYHAPSIYHSPSIYHATNIESHMHVSHTLLCIHTRGWWVGWFKSNVFQLTRLSCLLSKGSNGKAKWHAHTKNWLTYCPPGHWAASQEVVLRWCRITCSSAAGLSSIIIPMENVDISTFL